MLFLWPTQAWRPDRTTWPKSLVDKHIQWTRSPLKLLVYRLTLALWILTLIFFTILILIYKITVKMQFNFRQISRLFGHQHCVHFFICSFFAYLCYLSCFHSLSTPPFSTSSLLAVCWAGWYSCHCFPLSVRLSGARQGYRGGRLNQGK